jgi:hypothetical protein
MSVKRVILNLTDQEHADLSLKVREESLTQTGLMHFLLYGYLKDEPNIRKAVDKHIEEQKLIKHNRKRKHTRSVLKGKQLEKTFNLNDEDVDELYDIIEQISDL